MSWMFCAVCAGLRSIWCCRSLIAASYCAPATSSAVLPGIIVPTPPACESSELARPARPPSPLSAPEPLPFDLPPPPPPFGGRSEEHTSELQSHVNLVCRLLLEKKKRRMSTWSYCSCSCEDAIDGALTA